jgi:hypothetical protein
LFDGQAHLRETAAHLVLMANRPGWSDHARMRRDELLADPTYGDALKAEILAVMREAKDGASADH